MIRRFTTFAILCLLAVMAVQASAHTLTLDVTDGATGLPLAARAYVIDSSSIARAPADTAAAYFHRKRANDLGPFFYLPTTGTSDVTLVAAGSCSLGVSHGFEYTHLDTVITVAGDMTLEVALWPIEDMSALGLYSGDTHMHDAHGPSAYTLDYTDALFFCEAEDMDVINCLDAGQFNATPYTSGGRYAFIGEELRHYRLGHSALLGIPAVTDYLHLAYSAGHPYIDPCIYDYANTDSLGTGILVTAHPYERNWPSDSYWETESVGGRSWPREAPADAYYRKLDGYDVMFDTVYGWMSPRLKHIWNCGIKLAVTGGTDSTMDRTSVAAHPTGHVRTYVRIPDGETFSYTTWLDNISDGRTFATNGPLIKTFTVDGANPGDSLTFANSATETLDIVLDFESGWPVKRVDYLVNGTRQGGHVLTTGRTAVDTTATVTIEHGGGWVSAYLAGDYVGRIMGADSLFALTSPIYYTMDGMRPNNTASAESLEVECDRAIVFIDSMSVAADFSSPEESTRVIALIQAASDAYADKATRSTYTVGSGGDYATLALALAGDVTANDTIIMLDGVHVGTGNAVPNGVTIRSQGPDHRDLCTIRNPDATHFGVYADSLLHVQDITFRTNANITSNAIAALGATGAPSELRVDGVRFANCIGTVRQGGVYMSGSLRGWFKDCVWDSCNNAATAGADYPAAFFYNPVDLSFVNCQFTNNTATDRGMMAAYMDATGDSLTIDGMLVSGNACADMALVYLESGDAGNTINVRHFTGADNTVDSVDGVLATHSTGMAIVEYCSITHNTAGPPIRANWPPDTLRYCTFYGNLADSWDDTFIYCDTTAILQVDPEYATTSLDSTRAYMALSGAGAGPNFPRYTADGGYMGWLEPTKLPAPTLVSPANGATGQDSPTLTWNTVAYADNYSIEYGFACGTGDSIEQAAPDTTYVATTSPNHTYYWRAKTEGPDGWGPWSACFSFKPTPTGNKSGERRRRH